MCGIAGIIAQATQDSDVRLVKQMTDVLQHRGPDGEGIFKHDHIVFGHRRLSVIDIEHGAQPMRSGDGRYILTYNGEIYNYKELRIELESKGVTFATTSDTEVLLQMLIAYGEKAMDKLIGMFAFAFHDLKTGQTLLVRDEIGIKPLYYTYVNGKLLFASEIKALLLHPDVAGQTRLDNRGFQQYLTFQFCLEGQTLFHGIRALKPGHFLSFNLHEKTQDIKETCYWSCSYETDFSITEESCHETISELISDSLTKQLRSDVKLGAYLSGGIDSSLITAMAVPRYENTLKTFHGRFAEGEAYDESVYAKAVCEKSHAKYHETVPSDMDFIDNLPKIIYHMDEPSAGPGVFPQYCVSKLASQQVKVILGGQGGDEIFGGYARYVVAYLEQALKGAITGTNDEGKHIVSLGSMAPNLSILKQYTPLLKHFWGKGLFDDMDKRYFHLIDRLPNAKSILNGDVQNDHAVKETFQDFQAVFNAPDTQSYINKMTHFDLKTLLPALLQVEDRVSMASSIESRVPFIDKRIVEFMAKTPPVIKFSNGQTKHILKNIANDWLPDMVMNRMDKMGFPVPLKEWMQRRHVRDFVADILLSKASRERGLLNMIEIEKLIHAEDRFGRQLWGALCMELWHQIFIDKTMSPVSHAG